MRATHQRSERIPSERGQGAGNVSVGFGGLQRGFVIAVHDMFTNRAARIALPAGGCVS